MARRNRGKVLIMDRERRRGQNAAQRMQREGYEPLLFSDPRIAFAYAYAAGSDLAAAVVECDDGSERAFVQRLRLVHPQLRILAGLEELDRVAETPLPRWEPRSELLACGA